MIEQKGTIWLVFLDAFYSQNKAVNRGTALWKNKKKKIDLAIMKNNTILQSLNQTSERVSSPKNDFFFVIIYSPSCHSKPV